ncbi:MAG: SRPBCC domain-containing protein [Phycisphaeraceae bacterium]|nr:SRPBCC domain-containing protein [Phycisphaeraceae bacterium]
MATKLLDRPARIAVIDMSIDVHAPRDRVWQAFINETASWFYESEQTRTTHPSVLEPSLGGRFFIQTAGTQDENLLAMITCIKPPREIRLKGDFTIPQAFVANVTVKFQESGDATRITLTHRMAGDFDDDLPSGFDEGWLDGLQKLKRLLEG